MYQITLMVIYPRKMKMYVFTTVQNCSICNNNNGNNNNNNKKKTVVFPK